MLGYGRYAHREGDDFSDALDVWMRAGARIEPTVEDLVAAMRELASDIPLQRASADLDTMEVAA